VRRVAAGVPETKTTFRRVKLSGICGDHIAPFIDNRLMDESEFRRALHFGFGRAILHAREHDVRSFAPLILDACLNCYSIDPQCEGTRADFMFDLVNVLPDGDSYRDEVLNSLRNSGDDWHAKQRFRFASLMAQKGDERAKHVMYESFVPGPSKGDGIAIDFLNLDGMAGFLFAVEKIGTLLLANSNGVDLGWLMSVATDDLGEQAVWDCLRAEARENSPVQAYLSAIETLEARVHRTVDASWITSATYDQLKKKLPIKLRMYLRKWGEQATDDDLLQAAQGLRTTDVDRQLSHLAIFWKRRFPLDLGILFELANSSNERIQWGALKALTQITDPAVRRFAFELVRTRAEHRALAIDLLSCNFQPGDHDTIVSWFETEEDIETLHREGQCLVAFWKDHPADGLHTQMLCSLYEKGPCSFCRERAVSSLLERGALPEYIRAECAWDTNSEIRELISPMTGQSELP
jgi:hypothetical protein